MAREPRAIRGRLRHCNGIQSPNATGPAREAGWEGGSKVKPESQDTGLVALVWNSGFAPVFLFSDKEKDEASPRICCARTVNAFIPALWG